MEQAAAVAKATRAPRTVLGSAADGIDDVQEPLAAAGSSLPSSPDVAAKPYPPASCRSSDEEVLEAAEALASLAGATHATRSVKRMRGSTGAGDDFISRLPSDVLRTIISLLPTKDGVRSQAISRRWLPLWRSAPLNLVSNGDLCSDSVKRIAIVDKILSEHRGPARCLLLEDDAHQHSFKLNLIGWLHSPALSNLEELKIKYITACPLPPSVYRFAPTLRSAEVVVCHFSVYIPPTLNFPYLKQLSLDKVGIFPDVLHILLASCTALESLSVQQIIGVARLCISSRTLRSFGFQNCSKEPNISVQEMVIKDVPCLERLLTLDPDKGPMSVKVMDAPKLQVMGLVSDGIHMLQLGTTVFREMAGFNLGTKMHSVKILAIDSVGPNLDSTIGFLKCFPCLETLYVNTTPKKYLSNAQHYDPLDPIECLDIHLKKVVLKNCDCSKRPAVDFAKFFILKANVLKEMEIVLLNRRNQKWMASLHRQLRVEHRASRDAQIKVKSSILKDFIHNVQTHNLSIGDPFDDSSCTCIRCLNF